MKILKYSFSVVLCAGLLPAILTGCGSGGGGGSLLPPAESPAAKCAVSLKAAVGIEGPGGHSNGAFGNTSALHAAGNAITNMLDGRGGLPAGASLNINCFTGGNSVNSIAYNADFTVEACAAKEADMEAVKAYITENVKKGINEENAFRGIKEGQTNPGGGRIDVRLGASGIVFE